MLSAQNRLSKEKQDSSDQIVGESIIQALDFLKREWQWSNKTLSTILHIPESTVSNWLSKSYIDASKPFSTNVQILLTLISIHKNLISLFEKSEHQLKWLNTKHPAFGVSPFEKMSLSLSDLFSVRQYLDYVRGRGA